MRRILFVWVWESDRNAPSASLSSCLQVPIWYLLLNLQLNYLVLREASVTRLKVCAQ